MQKNIKILVHSKEGVLTEHSVLSDVRATGKPLLIKAQSHASYEIKDLASKVAPDRILAKRHGRNLEIHLDVDGHKGELSEAPDVIVEDYYTVSDVQLTGLAEDGQFYSYAPESGDSSLLSSEMSEGTASYQSLGSTAVSPTPAWMYIAGAAAGLGAIALATSSGGGGSTPPPADTTPPATPTVDIVDDSDTGISKTDNYTSDNTPTITGKTEAGATVTIKDKNGNVVGMATADNSGSYTITTSTLGEIAQTLIIEAKDAAGNTSITTQGITVDTTAPSATTLTERIDPSSDTGAVGDNQTNDTTPKMSGTGEAGDTITVTLPTGEVLVATVADDGTWSVQPTQKLLLGDNNITVKETDLAGNSTTETLSLSIVAPATLVVEITEDANNDGYINNTESVGVVDVKVTIDPTELKVGDKVIVSSGGVDTTIVLTAQNITDKFVTTSFAKPAENTLMSVTAVADVNGNRSASATDSAIIDTLPLNDPAGLTTVVIKEDTNNDGIINATELQGTVGVEVGLPLNAKAGDILTLNVTGANPVNSITLTQAQIDADKVIIELDAPANGTKITVAATVSDAAGNRSNTATDEATINTTPAGAPTVKINNDTNNDGYLNASELSTPISADVTLPITVVAGDKLVVDIDGTVQDIVLTQAQIDAGKVTISNITKPAEGDILNISAHIETAAGNVGANGTGSATIDSTVFGTMGIEITEDANNDAIINSTELQGTIGVKVTLPTGAVAGDKLTITASGNNDETYILTGDDITAGFITREYGAVADGVTFTVSATLTDSAGNVSNTATDTAKADTTAVTAPSVTIVNDTNNDGLLNATEMSTTLKASVTIPTGTVVDDKLEYTVNGVAQTPITLTQADIDAGSVTLTLTNPGEGNSITVVANIKDAGGNVGQSGSDTAKVDTTAPSATITMSDADLKAGETSTVTITFSEAVTNFDNNDVTVENGTLSAMTSSDNGITWTGTFTPTANMTDSSNVITLANTYTDIAGNLGTTASANYTIDTTPPAVIDLGDDGKLINPVFVDGNYYYYWDKDGDGKGKIDGGSDYDDTFTHDELDAIFMYDVNGGTRPSNLFDTNDTYRYDTINGYHLALPTFGGSKSDADPIQDGTVIDNVPAGEDNPTYNDLVAIWDAFNGGSVTTDAQSGVPAGWSEQFYWSATPHDGTGGHWGMDFSTGLGGTHGEGDHHWVAVQVIF